LHRTAIIAAMHSAGGWGRSNVCNWAGTNWGSNPVMLLRPSVAVRVAQYIAEWSEVESLLGLFLGLLLHTNQKAALAIYSGLENRSAQLRTITSAAKAILPAHHFEVISMSRR
jgi:hypothetical protein